MSFAIAIAPRGGPRPGRFPLLSATAALAFSAALSVAGDAGGQVIRRGTSELRFAGAYEPGKVPVVFVHGLLGAPGNWSVMIDRLSADPAVRARFQLLTFRYDSVQSIQDSGSRLVEALDEARRELDPQGRDPAFERVVLVGHSLGGLVAKVASHALDHRRLQSSRARPDQAASTRVGRLVFVATPHRGSPVDRGAIRSAGNWVARNLGPPSLARGEQSSSVDQLIWEHPLLAELERARAAGTIPFHSIIASLGDPSAGGATDGLVPVASAHLPGARSEAVVRAHHVCFGHPEVIREVRRILGEHAAGPVPPLGVALGEGTP